MAVGGGHLTKLDTAPGDIQTLKTEIISSLRRDLAEILRSELWSMLGDDFSAIKSELQVVKAEFSNTMVSMQT